MSVTIGFVPLAIAIAKALVDPKTYTAKEFCLDTGITDRALLKRVFGILDARVMEIKGLKGLLFVDMEKISFRLVRNKNGSFEAFFPDTISEKQGQQFIQLILGEYGKLVQQQVYQKVKTGAKDKGWIVENETVQEDNSILLTLQV